MRWGHRPCPRIAPSWLAAGAVVFAPSWFSVPADAGSSADWMAGDENAPSCRPDAFWSAHQMLDEAALRYVVAGRVVAAEGLPGTLLDADHEFEVALARLERSGTDLGTVTIEGRPAVTFDTADVQVEAREGSPYGDEACD